MIEEQVQEHPGEIAYIDGNTSEIVSRKRASQVPEKMRFVETTDGLVPVVKVVAHVFGDRRTIQEFGPNDELLRSTIQLRTPSGTPAK